MITKNISHFTLLLASIYSSSTWAGISSLFKDQNGETNWQHLANWTSGTLIIVLAVVILSLFFAKRTLSQSNYKLNAIRGQLEDRVIDRTATLDAANQNLTDTNKMLEIEVSQHLATSQQLLGSESYIKNILASMPLVLVSLDAKGNVTQWNTKAEQLSGIVAASAIGNNLWQVYPEIVLTWQQVQKVISEGESFTYLHSDRGVRDYDVTLYPLQGSDNEGVVILVNDVSKQKQAENILIHNEKLASMTELASAMAHDINTPLQGMLLDLQSFQQLLSRQDSLQTAQSVDAKKLNTLLKDASIRAESVASIIKNLLSFSRGRNDKKQPQKISLLLDNALALAADVVVLSTGLQFKDIKIERHYADNLPLLHCYPTELQQVMLNVIRHACYALDELSGQAIEPCIRLSVAREVDSLWITLAHNGAVLSDAEQVSIFEPSLSVILPQREVDAQKRLSFSYFIISEQHQGQMAVTSDVHSGTKFHIQLLLDSAT